MQKTTKKWALGAMFAAIAGYLAGLLTAPKSGKETRGDIKQAAQTGMAEAEKQLKRLHTELAVMLAEAKAKLAGLKGDAQKELDTLISKAGATKEKVREMLSAVHEGDVEDKDLCKAIDDATKAVEYLKVYLKKQV